MKKTILTFFIFALSFSILAQINAYQRFRVYGSVGFVNIRAGAGIGYEVIDTRRNGGVVYRNFSEQVTNDWIPVVYSDAMFRDGLREFHRGFIHQNLLLPLEEWWGASQIIASEINTEKRAQLQQQVNEIRSMELRHDTLFFRPSWLAQFGRYDAHPRLREILSFDETGRLRKYFWCTMPDETSMFTTIAFFNENGKLIRIFHDGGSHVSGTGETLWIYEGRIVDFLIEWGCDACEPPYDYAWTDEGINKLRAKVGSPLTETIVLSVSGRRPLTDFLDTQTLLSIVRCENYRGQLYRWKEIMDWE